jgi:hypothetical protein
MPNTDGASTGAQQNGHPRIISSDFNDSGFLPDEVTIELNRRITPEWIEKWKDHPLFAKMVIGRSLGLHSSEEEEFLNCFERAEHGGTVMRNIRHLVKHGPDMVSFKDLCEQPVLEPETIVEALVKRCEKTVFGGPSKAGKSWMMMNLAISIASGREWMGYHTEKGKVLYVNFELHKSSFKNRANWICDSRGIDRELLWDNLVALNLKDKNLTADEVVNMVIKRLDGKNFSTVFLDPTYKMLGQLKENDSSDMAQLLAKFTRLAGELQVAVVFATHFPKGNMSKRDAIDRLVGSGVLARDPDTIITMSPMTKKEREILERAAKGSKTTKKDTPTEKHFTILKKLTDGVTQTKWHQDAKSIFEAGSTFKRKINDLVEWGFVQPSGDGKGATYSKTEKGLQAVKSGWMDGLEAEESNQQAGEQQVSRLANLLTCKKIHRIDIELRDAPEQPSFVVAFKDFVHHRLDADLPDAEDEPDVSKKNVTAEHWVEPREGHGDKPLDAHIVECPDCHAKTFGFVTTDPDKAPDGGLKYALKDLRSVCICGDGRHFTANP